VYVVGQGWHAEIGIPVEELNEDLSFYRKVFSGARVIMFGYGKKTFFTAPPDTISEYFVGPIPGPAVIHVVGLRVTPMVAYPPEDTVTLVMPLGGAHALSAYIWNDLAKDAAGNRFRHACPSRERPSFASRLRAHVRKLPPSCRVCRQ